MRNVVVGDNNTGKTVLAKLIASVAHPDHVAAMPRDRDVDIEVHWFDPLIHDVATTGRSGEVSHILDGRRVPYVVRPYKTILLDGERRDISDLVSLSQMFDLSLSATKEMLSMLSGSSDMVKSVEFEGTRINWLLDDRGCTVRVNQGERIGWFAEASILFGLAGAHARYHASIEPTFLLLDWSLGVFHRGAYIALIDRLQAAAEYAQVTVITLPGRTREMPGEWTVTALEYRRPDTCTQDVPVDFVVDTTTTHPTASNDPHDARGAT